MKKNSSNVLLQTLNGISRITLNTPKSYNTLSFDMLNSLISTFKKLDIDNKTKVIIIEGAGNG